MLNHLFNPIRSLLRFAATAHVVLALIAAPLKLSPKAAGRFVNNLQTALLVFGLGCAMTTQNPGEYALRFI